MLIHVIKSRPRLISSFIFGACCAAVIPGQWLTRFLLGWNVAVWLYLFFMIWLMKNASSTQVAQLAEEEDRADSAIIAIMSVAASASLIAIVLELATVKSLPEVQKIIHYLITIVTVFGSWFFIGTIFTFHYAKMFYQSPKNHRALQFPDPQHQPDFWDFLYFSFTIAVAAQTSDISLTSTKVRKTALAQSVLCFWFNMAILGLSINIAAGLVGS